MRARLSYANVMATLAVFIALGGGAYAAATIGAGDIKKGAVRAKHVKQKQIRAPHIRKGAVRGKHLAPAAPGVALAGVRINSSGAVMSWFNRLGGKPKVEILGGSGRDVTFPGIAAPAGSIVSATITGGTTGEIFVGFAGSALRVRTTDSEGASDPSGFSLLLHKARSAG